MDTHIERNIFFIFSFCMLCFACTNVKETDVKSDEFHISAKTALPDTIVIVLRNEETYEEDSTYCSNGEFSFSGHVEQPSLYQIYLGRRRPIMSFFLENTEITIEQNGNEFMVTGSKSNDERKVYYEGLWEVWNKYRTVRQKKELNHEDSLELEKYFQDFKNAKMKFYNNYTDSYVTAYNLKMEASGLYDMELSKADISEIYSRLTDRMKNSPNGKAVTKFLSMPAMPEVGDRYLDFSLVTSNGRNVSVSDFKGKYVLVDFWASWCSPCRAQNPDLITLYNEYHSSGLEILGVSIDYKEEKWLAALKEDGLVWTNVWSEGAWLSDVCIIYRIDGIPDNLLIDPEGIIIGRDVKVDELEEVLESIFGSSS